MDRHVDGEIDLETAARVLGVHYQTAYRWVRTGALPAVKVGSGYRLSAADVAAVATVRQLRRPLAYTGRARDWDRLRTQLHAALVSGDDTAARRVFEMVHLARVPILEQCEQLLVPNLRCIGEEWEAGELSGARVRVAAGICERSLDWAVGRLAAARPSNGVALVVTPKDDEHRLPALMAGAALRDRGWAVRAVQGVGPADVVGLADRIRAAVMVVSVTVPEALDTAADIRGEVEESVGIPVLVGGPGKSLLELDEAATEPPPRP